MRKTLMGGVVGAIVAGLTLSACGSSDSSSTSSVAKTPAASATLSAQKTPAVSGPAFNVAAICSCSGAQASQLGRVGDVSKAWASTVNAAGGIAGHPVKLTLVDDGGNPATALKQLKDLIETKKIQAIVGDMSLADNSWASYVAKSGVPVIGGFSPSLPFVTNPTWFPTGAAIPVQTVGVGGLAKAAGKKKLGVVYCSESPLCKQLDPIAKGAAQLSGLGYASVAISQTAPSYTAPCLKLKSEGVDALFVASNSQVIARVFAACAQQGYKPLQVEESSGGDTTWLKNKGFEGMVLSSTNPDYTDASIPEVATFHEAIDKYAPGLRTGTQFSYDTLYPWMAGRLFEAAVAAGKLTPSSTRAEVTAAMYDIKGETLGGLSTPLTFTKGQPAFIPCYYGSTIKGGKFASLNGGKPSCLSAAQSKGLQAALAKALG